MNVADVHLDTLTPGSLPFEYLAFFLVGTVPRAWRYGSYARPASSPTGLSAAQLKVARVWVITGITIRRIYNFLPSWYHYHFPLSLVILL